MRQNAEVMVLLRDVPLDVGIDELVYLMLTGNTYINVHTLENPDGEIRGQIETGSGLVAEDDVCQPPVERQRAKRHHQRR